MRKDVRNVIENADISLEISAWEIEKMWKDVIKYEKDVIRNTKKCRYLSSIWTKIITTLEKNKMKDVIKCQGINMRKMWKDVKNKMRCDTSQGIISITKDVKRCDTSQGIITGPQKYKMKQNEKNRKDVIRASAKIKLNNKMWKDVIKVGNKVEGPQLL